MTQHQPSAEIKNLLLELRKLRGTIEKRRRRYLLMLLLAISLATTLVFIIGYFLKPEEISFKVFVVAGALVPSLVIFQILNNLYGRAAKADFTGCLSKGGNLRSNPAGMFSVKQVEKHLIIPSHIRGTAEDGFEGFHQGVNYSFQDVTLTNLRQDPAHRDHSKEMKIFSGVFVRIRLSRPLDTHTVIVPRAVLFTFLSQRFNNYNTLKLSHPGLEKIFEILALDLVEAKAILRQEFMDRFTEAGQMYRALWMEVSFRENEILLVFQRFRPLIPAMPLWRPMIEEELLRAAWEIESLQRIIEALKHNNQIGA